MSATTTIVCDGCGEEIRDRRQYPGDYYLELRAVPKASQPGAVLSLPPPPDETWSLRHFHDAKCAEVYFTTEA